MCALLTHTGVYWSPGLMLHFTWAPPPSLEKHMCPASRAAHCLCLWQRRAAFSGSPSARTFQCCWCDNLGTLWRKFLRFAKRLLEIWEVKGQSHWDLACLSNRYVWWDFFKCGTTTCNWTQGQADKWSEVKGCYVFGNTQHIGIHTSTGCYLSFSKNICVMIILLWPLN